MSGNGGPGDLDDDPEEEEVMRMHSGGSSSSSSRALRLLTVPADATCHVLATCCGMGANACSRFNNGLDSGLELGVIAGALTGSLSARAVSQVMSNFHEQERDFMTAKVLAGFATGGPVAVVVGGSCAVLGGVAGGVAGTLEDLGQDLAGAMRRTFRGMAANFVKPAVSLALGLSFDLKDGSRKVAQLPQEALPFLGALIGARRAGVLTEEDAFGRAAGFAARCALEMPGSDVPKEAEMQSRMVLLLTQLQSCYPWEGKDTLEEVVRRLVEDLEPDALDAVWSAFGPSSLQQWAYFNQGLLPRSSDDLSGDLLLRALDMRYEEERGNMVRVLSESFPGGEGEDYHNMLEYAHDALPRASFWKGYRLLQSGCAPRLPLSAVQNPEALERARAYLASLAHSPELPPETPCSPGSASSASPCGGPTLAANSGGFGSELALSPQTVDGSPLSLFMARPATLAPPPALLKAVEQAQSSLATADAVPQNSEHGGLWLEVLRLTGLRPSESSHWQNAATWLLGSRSQHPYVLVALEPCGKGRRGSLQSNCQRTRAVAVDAEGCVDFGEAVSFPLGASDVMGTTLEKLELRFQVLDRRAVFGDPLIGEGTLGLTDKMLGAFQVHKVSLKREGAIQGSLLIRAGVLTPPSALGILERSSKEPLAVVMKAFAQLLAQPCCVGLLMESRPKELVEKQLVDESMVHKMLQSWVVAFCASVSRLRSTCNEEEVIQRLVRLARMARGIAAECADVGEDGNDVEDLLVDWLHGFCARCAGAESSIELDQARLSRILEASRAQHRRLEDLGVQLPEKLPAALAQQIYSRLLEAERCQEREIFTGVRIVRNGQVASGLAVVLQRFDQGTHVFIYSHIAIREWQRNHLTDPCTRKVLLKSDIFPLTPL